MKAIYLPHTFCTKDIFGETERLSLTIKLSEFYPLNSLNSFIDLNTKWQTTDELSSDDRFAWEGVSERALLSNTHSTQHEPQAHPVTYIQPRNDQHTFTWLSFVNMMFMRKVCCFLLCCVFEASVARRTEEAETLEKTESARCVSRCLTLHITQITASFKHLQVSANKSE